MKTRKILVLLMVMYACSDESIPLTNDAVINTMQSGTWRISYFNDNGTDETHHFTGYAFTFNTNGTVTAANGANTYNGTWSVTTDSSGKVKFNLAFAAPPAFEELTEDWEVVSRTSTRIELKHVSGGGGGTDFLTFLKN